MFPAAHCSASLRYRLIAGDVALEPLHVLKTHELTWHDWHVHLFVLGASHAVRLTRTETQLTELLTCLPPVEYSPTLFETAIASCHQERLVVEGLRWDVRLWNCQLEPKSEAEDFPAEQSFQVVFPCLESSPAPLTRICWHTHADMLCIETLHTYPNEGRSVRTRTRLQSISASHLQRKEQPE